MSRLLRALAACALLAPAASALAFARATTDRTELPSPALDLWWRPRQIAFQVNASDFVGAGCAGPEEAAAAVRASFPAWQDAASGGVACTDFMFNDCGATTRTDLGYDQGDPGNNVNLVVFRRGLCSLHADPLCQNPPLTARGRPDFSACIAKYNCWADDDRDHGSNTIALTTVTWLQATGEIVDADMELNGWNGDTSNPAGVYFTCTATTTLCSAVPYGASGCADTDVQNAVTHEAGHILGLQHVCTGAGDETGPCPAGGSVMEATADRGDLTKRTLTQDDVAAVCGIYPAGGRTVTGPTTGLPGQPAAQILVGVSSPQSCPVPKRDSGCGAGGGGALALLAVLPLALRRRRARRS